MRIDPDKITIRKLVKNYRDDGEEGIVGYGGRLDIRPKYQREFVYNDKQQEAVINTVRLNRPLNVMYWVVKDDGNYEVLDGQQRIISICRYFKDAFSFNHQFYSNLEVNEIEEFLNYELHVYFCEGNDREKLDWFETINIAGEKLTPQELKNAIYSGPWLSAAKRYFSKTKCRAYRIGKDYIKGSPIRQEYLETALKWKSDNKVLDYMAQHQHEEDALELINYFESVITWVDNTFSKKRKEMKGVDWGMLYAYSRNQPLSNDIVEIEVRRLMEDDDVTKKSGIYPYIITREEKYLNIRAFSKSQKRQAFERQKGICPITGKKFDDYNKMHADHIVPWSKGGKTIDENCQMLDPRANLEKSNK